MERILVVGGTGLLGRPVAERLLQDGYAVRLLTRHPTRLADGLAEAELMAGDATDAGAVARAAVACNGIHVSVSGQDDQTAAEVVAKVAPAAGVKRITYLSGSTVSPEHAWFPMIAAKLAAERALEAGPVPATILRSTWPMEQLPRFVRGGRAVIIGAQPTPLHWFAAADLARMVARVHRSDDTADRCLYVHGPQALTMREALERYCRTEQPEVEVTTMSVAAARAAAQANGDPMLGFIAELMSYFDRAGELGDAAEADRLLGPNRITLDQWLAGRQLAASEPPHGPVPQMAG